MTALVGAVSAMFIMFALAAVVLWLRDRAMRPSAARVRRQAEEYERALRNPDWETVREEFNGTIPQSVETLYRNEDLLARRDIQLSDGIEIGSFIPADDSAFDPEQWFDPPEDSFVIATTRFGDPLFVRTSEVKQGLPVSVLFHETGEIEQVAPTLADLLERVSGQRSNSPLQPTPTRVR